MKSGIFARQKFRRQLISGTLGNHPQSILRQDATIDDVEIWVADEYISKIIRWKCVPQVNEAAASLAHPCDSERIGGGGRGCSRTIHNFGARSLFSREPENPRSGIDHVAKLRRLQRKRMRAKYRGSYMDVWSGCVESDTYLRPRLSKHKPVCAGPPSIEIARVLGSKEKSSRPSVSGGVPGPTHGCYDAPPSRQRRHGCGCRTPRQNCLIAHRDLDYLASSRTR